MVGITYVYIDTIFAFYGYILFLYIPSKKNKMAASHHIAWKNPTVQRNPNPPFSMASMHPSPVEHVEQGCLHCLNRWTPIIKIPSIHGVVTLIKVCLKHNRPADEVVTSNDNVDLSQASHQRHPHRHRRGIAQTVAGGDRDGGLLPDREGEVEEGFLGDFIYACEVPLEGGGDACTVRGHVSFVQEGFTRHHHTVHFNVDTWGEHEKQRKSSIKCINSLQSK